MIAAGAAALAVYLLLAGEVSGAEAIAAVPVAVLAGLYAGALRRTQSAPMRLRARGVWALLLGCRGVLPDTWRVGRALWRAVVRPGAAGAVTQVAFRFGALRADDIGRRAAVVVGISLAPNGIALGMDRAADELIVHQLVPQPIGGDREWPG